MQATKTSALFLLVLVLFWLACKAGQDFSVVYKFWKENLRSCPDFVITILISAQSPT